MLVPGLEGCRPAQQEELRRGVFLGDVPRPVIVHLVVVVAHDEWRRGVRCLQVGIALVERVALPVVVERVALVRLAGHDAHDGQRTFAGADDAIFVDVVAIVEDKIEAFGGDLPIRREVAVFIALAPDNAKAQLCHRGSHGWQCPGAAYRAALTADGEVIEIVASRLEPAYLDVHRVVEFGMGHGRALLRHLAHAFVGGDGPGDLHRLPR